MIRKFITGSRKVIIGTDYRGDYHAGNLPKRKEIFSEPEKNFKLMIIKCGTETESLRNILKSINTLDNIDDNYHETETILSDEEDTNVYTNNLDDE